ncbi:DUF5667 domain-containing protein [Streptosporangium sp. NBC_01755]|uniref:DUF5667 domain-containing protein n=1 Tax=unclassified Streptosporangium TaxID=2632669 RepID=UPI002DDB7AA5|nr:MULTISPECIES: DUF5667 domain-containing protein [unclassified Streptosporangium]WSA24858.1 DUF5667 domain-containing protein [Streptosporangium sp. NBC_01810]WSD03959.1 DUF5667 domain-containing protein [Streptosporangium sp. NBC_01755]
MSRLGNRMAAVPHPEFHARLREQLTQGPPGEDLSERPPTGPRHSRRRPGTGLFTQLLSVALVASMVTSGVWTYRSMPGDTFYPLKRAAERTLFHLSTDDAERAERSFGYAETRAREVEKLLGGEREYMIGETLQAMEDTTRSAVTSLKQVRRRDASSARELKRFVQKQRTQISGMLPKMDAEDQRKAHVYLNYIDGLAPPE